MVASAARPLPRVGGVEDRVLRQEDVLVGTELGTDVIHVGNAGPYPLVHIVV